MSEFKGTNGKWKVWQKEGLPIVGSLSGVSLFIVSKSSETSPHHYDANALLISKAPEMLEMLINISKGFDDSKKHLIVNKAKQLIKESTRSN